MGEGWRKFIGYIWSTHAILAGVLLALTMLSFHGALDDLAYDRLSETTNESVGIYALARTTNAGISVLQSSEVGMAFIGKVSVKLGEALDPINDAIERLSSIMLWAIGSLLLQRLALEVTSTAVFRWGFFCIGVVAFLALFLPAWKPCRDLVRVRFKISDVSVARCRDLLVRIFVIGAIVRFIVPGFVIVSVVAAEMFLGTTIQEHRDRLSVLSADVEAGSPVAGNRSLASQKDEMSIRLKTLQAAMEGHQREKRRLDDEIRRRQEEAGWRGWPFVPVFLGGVSPGEQLLNKREEVSGAARDIQTQIDQSRDDLQCIERQVAGETCGSLFDKLSGAGKTGYARIASIVEKASNWATSIVRLSIAIVIKNVLFPIIFLVIAMKCSLPFIRYAMRKCSTWQRDLNELPNSLRRLD